MGRMSFFADVPEPEIPEPQEWVAPEWFQPPENEVPVEVPLALTLYRDDRRVLVLQRAQVHSNGCAFALQWHTRRVDEPLDEWHAGQGFHSVGRRPLAESLRFGMLFADGSRATTVPTTFGAEYLARPEGRSLRFNEGGGGGGQDRYMMNGTLWAWPLPPDGPATLVLEWRAQGVPETQVTLEPIAFSELAASARPLWH